MGTRQCPECGKQMKESKRVSPDERLHLHLWAHHGHQLDWTAIEKKKAPRE